MRRELPQIARAVDAIVQEFARRWQAFLRRGRHQRSSGGARRGGMSANVWSSRQRWCRRSLPEAKGPARRGRGRRGFSIERRARLGARRRNTSRRGGRDRGQRNDALRAWRADSGQISVVRHGRRDIQSEFALGSRGDRLPSARNRAKKRFRVDAYEGRNSAENGAQHAFHQQRWCGLAGSMRTG